MATVYTWILLCGLSLLAVAAPSLRRETAAVVVPPITNATTLDYWIAKLKADLNDIEAAIPIAQGILEQIVPAPSPNTVADLLKEVNQVLSAHANDVISSALYILLGGLAGADFATIYNSYTIESSSNNTNPPLASNLPAIYPKAESADAPYSVSEHDLRAAMYIPPDFTYGKLPPVLLIPGTATIPGQAYGPNYGKLLKSQGVADVVYINVPGMDLGDVQVNAEYVAYATNYISSVTGGKNVSTISFSQGSVDGQWALKYWPSTRSKTSNKISLSPDYHGSTIAVFLCPGIVVDPSCTDGLAQQRYDSQFVATLRNNGGDSAYVPTTNVYTIFDEAVQPQTAGNASGSLYDARGVGVSNTELQAVCGPLLPGGTADYDHESMLYNPLAYGLAVDAIKNGGPGQVSRLDTTVLCAQLSAAGLSLGDMLSTEAVAPLALLYGFLYYPKVADEPPIKAYAQHDIPA